MVLDGAVDPAASYSDQQIQQAVGFDRSLAAFFAWCRNNSQCPFASNADPRTAYNDLMTSLASHPRPTTVQGEHRALGAGEASIGIANALYSGTAGFFQLGSALN